MASSYPFQEERNQVLFEYKSAALIVTLNRPQKLNTLTYPMISQILRTLKAHENDSRLKVLILKGEGKAFCAGGDVARAVQSVAIGDWTFGAKFYNKQLTLDYLLATYKKPPVSIINGLVMGGGAGLSMHGRFQIVTEKAIFAMPEASIGLFTDVGASHFLSRLPGFFGEYLGLTGARIDGSEMLACGLATHFVQSKDIVLLEKALCEVVSSDPTIISSIINKFGHKKCVKQESAYSRLDVISTCFSKKTVEEILSSLENELTNGGGKWVIEAISSMKKASPTSLKVSLRLIREGRTQKLEQCLLRDYNIACHMLSQINSDFFEGARALIFDKDKNPKWKPSKLELITEEMVDQLLTEMDDDDWEHLRLPVRSNLAKPKL